MKTTRGILLLLVLIVSGSELSAQAIAEERYEINYQFPTFKAGLGTEMDFFDVDAKKKRRKKKKKKRGRGGEQNDIGMLLSFDYMFGVGKGVGFTPFFTLGKENATIRFSFHFTTPVTFNDEAYGYAFSSATSPSSIMVPVKYRYSMFAIGFDYKRFFFGGSPADGGFYGFAGAGASYIPVKATLGTYDEALYYTMVEEKERYFQPNIRFGLGADIWLSSFGLTFEALLALPANQVMGMEYDIQLPPYVSLGVGAKFGL